MLLSPTSIISLQAVLFLLFLKSMLLLNHWAEQYPLNAILLLIEGLETDCIQTLLTRENFENNKDSLKKIHIKELQKNTFRPQIQSWTSLIIWHQRWHQEVWSKAQRGQAGHLRLQKKLDLWWKPCANLQNQKGLRRTSKRMSRGGIMRIGVGLDA